MNQGLWQKAWSTVTHYQKNRHSAIAAGNFFCKWCQQQRSRSRKSGSKGWKLWQRIGRHQQIGGWKLTPQTPPVMNVPINSCLRKAPQIMKDGTESQITLNPRFTRMADGMADRVDRIRACGNGVVPLVAAYAWRTHEWNVSYKEQLTRKTWMILHQNGRSHRAKICRWIDPLQQNARLHSESQVAQIAASIIEFVFTNPVLIDGEKELLQVTED